MIPNFTIDGVVPPYIGANGPGGASSDMTPYATTVLEVVQRFGTTLHRRAILRDWLQHRDDMRTHGINTGFQWIDGSFVEDKVPNDIDVVTFFYRPPNAPHAHQIFALFNNYADVFRKPQVKLRLKLDALFIDLNSSPEALVTGTSYWNGLFSHRRNDDLWKGMVRVPLDHGEDAAALAALDLLDATEAASAPPAAPVDPANIALVPAAPVAQEDLSATAPESHQDADFSNQGGPI